MAKQQSKKVPVKPDAVACHTDAELEQWAKDQRTLYAAGELAPAQIKLMEELPGWSWESGAAGTSDEASLRKIKVGRERHEAQFKYHLEVLKAARENRNPRLSIREKVEATGAQTIFAPTMLGKTYRRSIEESDKPLLVAIQYCPEERLKEITSDSTLRALARSPYPSRFYMMTPRRVLRLKDMLDKWN